MAGISRRSRKARILRRSRMARWSPRAARRARRSHRLLRTLKGTCFRRRRFWRPPRIRRVLRVLHSVLTARPDGPLPMTTSPTVGTMGPSVWRMPWVASACTAAVALGRSRAWTPVSSRSVSTPRIRRFIFRRRVPTRRLDPGLSRSCLSPTLGSLSLGRFFATLSLRLRPPPVRTFPQWCFSDADVGGAYPVGLG